MSDSNVSGDEGGSESTKDKIQESVDHAHTKKPVHSALGGGKSADVLPWRNKQITSCLLAGSTVIWLLFEWIGYHLLTFVCHSLILSLATLFLSSNLSFFFNKSPVELPEIALPEDFCRTTALLLRTQFHEGINMFRHIASGRDLKNFLYAILSLWLVSVIGSWCDFLTLLYIIFVVMLTLPMIYEKHEDKVDSSAKKASHKLMKQYNKLDESLLQKLPRISISKDTKEQ